MNEITIDELMALSRKDFVERNLAWLQEFKNGEPFPCVRINKDGNEIDDPTLCPLHQYVVHNKLKCPNEMVSDTAFCPLCENPMCPVCNNHMVDQLSRVTGYMAPVSGWGAAKKQEFKDRKRHQV